MNDQFCLCGAQAHYPHANDCPRPLYQCSDKQEKAWFAEQSELRQRVAQKYRLNRARVIPRELTVRLHNEPINLTLGELCRCPVCQPDLHAVEEGGEA